MHIIIGIGAAVAPLYFWLCGGWFARVLAFLVFAAVLGILGAELLTPRPVRPHDYSTAFAFGVALAWPVSGIPRYWQAWISFRQTRRERAEAARQRAELDDYIRSRRRSRS